jgi:sugar diacid utilization regulator
VRPLAVVRQDEIVIVRALGAGQDPRGLNEPIARAQKELADTGLELAVGVSTAFETIAGLPAAYCEACAAIEALGPGGLLALTDLSAFDYLTLRGDATALRLLAPAVRRFVEEDAAGGGALIGTLRAYAAANLNAKVAAERLYVHVNTAHHRLSRIEEKTGCDLRDLADVQELLIAIKLLDGRPARS